MTSLTSEQRRQRVLALAVVVAAYALSFFQRFAPAGIAQDLASAFSTSAASLGVLAASYFYVYTLMQVPTGILVDTLGPRRILLLGGLVASIGSLAFATASDLHMALIGRTLVGLGVSVVFIAMLKIIAVWYEEQRFATVVGLAMLLGNLGSVLSGAPLSWSAQVVSWRGVFLGVGLLSLLLTVLCWLWVRDRPSGRASSQLGHVDRTVVLASLLSVLRNRATWPAVVVNFGLAGSFFAFAGLWATPYLAEVHGYSRGLASTHLSVFFAAFALGCLVIGSLSDRLGRRRPVILVAAHLYALLWLVWLSGMRLPVALTVALFALMGAVTASFTLTWALAKEVNAPHLSGMATSVTNTGGFLGGALMQPLTGWLMDLSWSGALVEGARVYQLADYRRGLALPALAAGLGALYCWRLPETHCHNIHKELGR